MSQAVQSAATGIEGRSERALVLSLLFVVGSVALHVVGFWVLNRWVEAQPPPKVSRPIELLVIDVPPPPKVEEKKEEPPPEPKKVKPPPVRVAKVTPPKELPKEQPPPPPNEEPPPETPKKVVPLIVGISMSSTSTAGNFAAPVGNTMYGKAADKAVKPEDVKAYVAPKYVPPYQVDTQPLVLSEVRGEYTKEARTAGIEGSVQLKVTIDAEGNVADVKLMKGLGHGLDEVALQSVRRFRWKPATKNGEAVSTTITYTYTFILD